MKTYFRLVQYCRPIAPYLIPYFIFTFLGILFGLINFTLLIPLLDVLFGNTENEFISHEPEFTLSVNYFKDLFNYHFSKVIAMSGKYAALKFVCIAVIVSVFFANVFKYLGIRLIEKLKAQTALNLRQATFDKVTGLNLGFFSNNNKGNIMQKITGDVGEVEHSITSSFSVIFKEPVSIIVYFVALFMMSAKLTFFTILIIPISGGLISLIVKRLKRDAREASEIFGRIMNITDETLSGMRVVKAFGAETYTRKKFYDFNREFNQLSRKINMRKELASPFSEFTGVSVVTFILLYGGSLVLSNESSLTASQFVTYIIIFSQVLTPAKALSNSMTNLNRGLAAGERILELIDTPNPIKEAEKPALLPSFEQNISFKNVSFAYGDKKVLDNISFEVKKGQTVALVGPSGGGKSTLADLVPRFYDPASGSVHIDGIDLRDCSLVDLRRQMGIVTQESVLFNDTIFNNIAYGTPGAKKEDVMAAAKIANAHEFIEKSEAGYQTFIGDRGMKLSGGQRQRLCIARAVFKNPPILILDEATSALDTESEKLVQDALNNLMKNRTSIVIAHRLSTVQNADKILVVEAGKIAEEGSHDELMQIDGGIYRRLVMLQSL